MLRSLLLCALLLAAPPALAGGKGPRGPRGGQPKPKPTPVAQAPKTIVGPSVALAMPLTGSKPVGLSFGVQAVFPSQSWRFAGELFASTPVTAFTPAIGGDAAVGLVNSHSVGGAIALYGRYTFAKDTVDASSQVGPGLVFLSKVAPTVLITVPFVLWIDTATQELTPTLAVKGVFGVPYGH